MKLVIIKDNFNINKIRFRKSKTSIKITYDISNLLMIGITFNVIYQSIKERGTFLYINLSKEDYTILKDIENYFYTKIEKYESFLINDGYIRIKKHNGFIPTKENNINIVLSSIKLVNDKNRVQIFSI